MSQDDQRNARWRLAAIIATFCVLGAVYSFSVPLFEAPDEIWHFSFVRVLATQRSMPLQPTEGKDMWLREAAQPPLYYLVAAPLVAPLDTSDFPGFARFNLAHPAVTAGSQSKAPNVFIHTDHEAFPYHGAVLAVHIVRLLSVLWGAGTVAGAFLVARQVVPGRPGVALAAAAMTAFNPHFVFISSVVNNDVAAACLCTVALWLTIRLAEEEATRGLELALGLVLGLALLSKLSALALLFLVALALGLKWVRDRDSRGLVVRGSIVFGVAAVIAAWWYARNWMLYGDPLAWDVWLADIGVRGISLPELLTQLGHVATSFWSPYDGLFPTPVFWGLGLLAVLAVAGWVRLIAVRRARAGVSTPGLLLASAWFVVLFASLVRYMTTTPSAEGRLLFPGIGALSLLLTLGLDAAVPRRWSAVTLGVVTASLFTLAVASPFYAIAPRFARPLVSPMEAAALGIPLDNAAFGQVRLLAAEVEPREVEKGSTVNVTLFWQVEDTPPADLRAVVRLWTVGGRLVGQRDSRPAGEIYPPDLWRAGDVVRDEYQLRVQEGAPAQCRVSVSVLAGNIPLGEVSTPAVLRLAAAPISIEQIPHPLSYTLGGKVQLVGFDMAPRPEIPGEALEVTFYWRGLGELDADYTAFVHLLDQHGDLCGQADGPPLNGHYPTSYWAPGEVLADKRSVHLQGCASGGTHLLVGLYRPSDGTRLPPYTAAGERVPDDAIVIDLGTTAPAPGALE